jgi:site-specific DNA-methyltransferase (adenine-specific)
MTRPGSSIQCGDCIERMRELPDCSVSAIVTDPPYEIGLLGRAWDKTGIANSVEMWSEALRVLKPGGYLIAFSSTRTYHRMACAVEDAGFEIRDMIEWVYGQGFPHSLDVAKAISKAAGAAERRAVGSKKKVSGRARKEANNSEDGGATRNDSAIPASATVDAKTWAGWGTALKPSHEPMVVARKPQSEKTVAANVLKHGTGALNVDGCRIAGEKGDGVWGSSNKHRDPNETVKFNASPNRENFRSQQHELGRWPANLILSEEAAADLDQQAGASRFFYVAKPSKRERNAGLDGAQNPCVAVKPITLMRFLIRLVCKPGGTVLDPFAGSGTTGCAAALEPCVGKFIGIELDPEHAATANARIAHWLSSHDTPARPSDTTKPRPLSSHAKNPSGPRHTPQRRRVRHTAKTSNP